jgi:uncharacterized protein
MAGPSTSPTGFRTAIGSASTPVFESFDIAPLVRVRPAPLRVTRFVLDGHLGRLAGYLRLFGFDVLYRHDYADAELARTSHEEGRILLTRDRGLLKRREVSHGYCVRATDPRRQIVEVLRRFDLFRSVSPFSRCLRCNGVLQPVDREEVLERLPPKTRKYYDEFDLCPSCDRLYWKGSHYERLARLVQEVLALGAAYPETEGGSNEEHTERQEAQDAGDPG